MDWEQYRNKDGSIDLMKAFNDVIINKQNLNNISDGFNYIQSVLYIQQIKSRQVAAVILTNATDKSQ